MLLIRLRQEFDARRKIILSQSYLFSNKDVVIANWRSPTIRLWIRRFFNDPAVVLVPYKPGFPPFNWQILSKLWQTLYLLGVQTCVFLPIEMPEPRRQRLGYWVRLPPVPSLYRRTVPSRLDRGEGRLAARSMERKEAPNGASRRELKSRLVLRQGELAALGFLEPVFLSFDTDLPAYRSIKSALRGLACWRIPVALGRHRFDQVLAVHRLLGFLKDARRRIQGAEFLGRSLGRRCLMRPALLGLRGFGFLGAVHLDGFLRCHDSSPLGSRTSRVATIAKRVSGAQLPPG